MSGWAKGRATAHGAVVSAVLLVCSCSRPDARSSSAAPNPSVEAVGVASTAFVNAWTTLWASPPQTQAEFDADVQRLGFTGNGHVRNVADETGEASISAPLDFDPGLVMITITYEPKVRRAMSGVVLDAIAREFKAGLATEPDVVEFSNGVIPQPGDPPGKLKMEEIVRVRLSDGAWVATERTITWRQVPDKQKP